MIDTTPKLPRTSVIGLGKLGAPLAATLASKGIPVIGVDRNPAVVEAIAQSRAPIEEPGLGERLEAGRDHLEATTDTRDAVLRSDVSLIVLPTPSNDDGRFSNRFLLEAIAEIGAALRAKDDYHVVAITSTVMPGSTGGVLREALEAASGRRVGVDVGLCYNPEFIALGSVIRDMLEPDFILIGESDRCAGDLLSSIYPVMCDNEPEIRRMNLVNAEITKIAVNTYVTTKISYANMLAGICEKIPGADVDVVTDSLGKDRRIGPAYLRGALPYGGPCFPRDNRAFSTMANNLGARCDLAEATDRINLHQTDRLLEIVRSRVPSPARVGILGLAYKPDTPVIDESTGINLAEALERAGYGVIVHDPLAQREGCAELEKRGVRVEAADSVADLVDSVEVLVITVMKEEFAKIPAGTGSSRLVVIDPWRLLPADGYGESVEIVHPGRCT